MTKRPTGGGSAAPHAREAAEPAPSRGSANASRRRGDVKTHPGRYAVIILTAVIGTLISVGIFSLISGWDAHLAELRFISLARGHLETLNSGLTDTTDVLRSLRAYFQSFDHMVTRDEYQRFSRSLRERAVGLRDTLWAPRVTAADRDGFERDMRATGWPDFQILEFTADHKMVRAKDRPVYFPIIYSEPGAANRSVMGFDLASEPLRSRTIARALGADDLFVTPPLKLVNQNRPVGGMMGFIPVTRETANDARSIEGVVGGVFETAPMIENILSTKVHLAELDIYVFDPAGSIGNRLIYWHSTAGRPVPSESALLAAWHWQGTLQLADQQWGVIFAPTETFARGAADWTAMAALATGLAITATIAGYLWLTLRRTRQLENLTASLGETTEELRRNGAKLDHLARHDALTGLPNRTLFRENIAIGLRNASRGHGFAVLYLDLDRFKTVNDTLGHQAGDQLLCQVADRLHDAVRETDTITRLGGDEFAIAQCMADQPGAAEMLARRVIDLLSSPYKIGGHLVVVGVSVGITLAGRDDLDADHLLRRADMALYAAKRSGRGTWRFFQPLMEQEAQARRGLEMDLRHALQHKEFELYYQPQVHVADGRVVGFEALLRWNHPDRGLVGPGDFLRCAEESGLILPIGDWVLMTALKESASWPAGVRVAVNISSHQLGRDDLAAAVQAALSASRQTGMRLELEVTEGALIEHQGTGQAALRHLRDLGVHIALDDFGTGHASLSHLRSFPFDRIKIDQSFVAAITESPEGATIVRSILQFAANLNITTTGEGVERPEQLALLAAMGCCEAQGFLFSPARPASEVPRLLAGWPTLARDAVSSTVTSLGPAARIVPAAVHVDP